ncbi:DoxX family protein [Streptomyces sp. NPDC059161]|uniref:DoxX family protein n=1 Tax=Streptomyces sp. NPDC059161 TaxID=3346749 RepID=UPI00369E57AE
MSLRTGPGLSSRRPTDGPTHFMEEPTTSVASAGADTTQVSRHRRTAVAITTVRIVLALFYGIASALPKLLALPAATSVFDRMGWGSTGMYAIGVLELAGAIALLLPALSSLAALCLVALMAGAFVTQLVVMDGQNAATPLIFMVPLLTVAWHGRARLAELPRMIRAPR